MLNVELGLVSSTKRGVVHFYAAREDQSPLARLTIACLKLVGSRGVTVRHLISLVIWTKNVVTTTIGQGLAGL